MARKKRKKKAAKKKASKPRKFIRRFAQAKDQPSGAAKARTILQHAHESADGFLDSFLAVRKQRGAAAGTTTDEEQDLLRAALVFAAAGLDSTLKQLIRDTMPELAKRDSDVRAELETFAARQLRGLSEDSDSYGRKFLARVLTAKSHLERVIEEYVYNLTGVSLQSADEVLRTVKALGLDQRVVGASKADLQETFKIRNKIIHELDISLNAPRRNRESRSRKVIAAHANRLLETGEKILTAVEKKLAE